MEIIFLGTGGGRWMTITQLASTAGFRIHEKKNIHVDPGAGAILRMRQKRINPVSTHALLLSHCHPDHYTDAEVIIEAMTKGMTKKRGILAGSKSTISGFGELEPAVSKYHRSMVEEVREMGANESRSEIYIDEMRIEATKAEHSDPTSTGFKFYTKEGVIGYTGDTQYFEGMPKIYSDAEYLIINTIKPANERIRYHMCSEDIVKILSEIKPKKCIITHFGIKMHPVAEKEAKAIREKTGVDTLAARDGMRIVIR